MVDGAEALPIHDIEFVAVEGRPKAIGLKIMSGPGQNDKRHVFLATKETLELFGQRCLEQATKMPHSPAGMA